TFRQFSKKKLPLLFYSSFKKWYTRLPAKLGSKCVRITIKNALPSWRSISFYQRKSNGKL
ncbi:TPA: hypothetical protein ACOP9Q_001300, partial [Streptococcus pneumoniae]